MSIADMKKEAGIAADKIKKAVHQQVDLVKNAGVYTGVEVKNHKDSAEKEARNIRVLQEKTTTDAHDAVIEVREMTKDINKYLKNEYHDATREVNQTAKRVTKEIKQAVK